MEPKKGLVKQGNNGVSKRRLMTAVTVALIAGVLGIAGIDIAQGATSFPTKPITLIVPWAPGGTGDMSCRIIAPGMEKVLKQPVVVKNVPGAGSMIGAKELVASKPDGYTIGFLGSSAAIGQYMSISPVMLEEYVAVSGLLNPSLVLFVNQNAPWKKLEEFIDYAKKNPSKLKHGNSGTGGNAHLYSEQMAEATGAKFTEVPYKGFGPGLAELAGGHVDFVIAGMGAAKPLIGAGKIRALAIGADKRHPVYPDIPTIKESGYNIRFPFWESIVVPRGTSKETISILDEAIRKAFANPEVKQRIQNAALDLEYLDTEGIAKLRKEFDANISRIIKKLGLDKQKQ